MDIIERLRGKPGVWVEGQEKKREISVGFLPPEKLEGRIIYVQLGKENSEAISAVDFSYLAYSIGGNLLHEKGRKANSYDYDNCSRADFVEMLQKQNDGVISDRFIDDGLKAATQLKNISRRVIDLAANIATIKV